MTFWFTSDQHYGHTKIIQYCDRPFSSAEEMDEMIIEKHNKVVKDDDIVINAGDFTLRKGIKSVYIKYIDRLNGRQIFLKGSHDYWLKGKDNVQILEKNLSIHGKKYYVVVCHYNMRTWARSHYNSWQLHGHSHGKLKPVGKQHDIGVDNNNFYPVADYEIERIMQSREDNFNLVLRPPLVWW